MLNMSQAELAERANLQRRDVIQFENDVYLPTPSAQTAIERVLGVDFNAPIIISVEGELQSGQSQNNRSTSPVVQKTVAVDG